MRLAILLGAILVAAGLLGQTASAVPAGRVEFIASSFDPDAGPWTWAEGQLVQFVANEGHVLVTRGPPSGPFEPLASLDVGTDRWRPGQAVHLGDQVLLLANWRTVCPSDYCEQQDLPFVVVVSADDWSVRLEPVASHRWSYRTAIPADDVVYLVAPQWAPSNDMATLLRYDPRTGESNNLTFDADVELPGVWTGTELLFLSKDFVTAQFVAFDPSSGLVRRFGDGGFKVAGSAWLMAGSQVLLLGGRTSPEGADNREVVVVGLADGALTTFGRLHAADLGTRLGLAGGRVLALATPATCWQAAGHAWLDAMAPTGGGQPPVANATAAIKAYHPELDQAPRREAFYIQVDPCNSTDTDGFIVDADVVVEPGGQGLSMSGEWRPRGVTKFRVTVWDDDGNANVTRFDFLVEDEPVLREEVGNGAATPTNQTPGIVPWIGIFALAALLAVRRSR